MDKFKKIFCYSKTLKLLIFALLSVLIVGYFCSYNSATLLRGNNTGIIAGYQQDADVKIDFRYDTIYEEHENLFQTAAGNEGLRVEFGDGGWNGGYGLVFTQNGKVDSIYEGCLPLPGIWHSLEAKVVGDKLGLYLDGAFVGMKSVDSSKIMFNDLAAGTGFNKERNFSGEVKNFEVRLYKHQRILGQLPLAIMILLDLCAAYYVAKSAKITLNKDNCLARGGSCLRVLYR